MTFTGSLRGQAVLIVEDEPLIALDLAREFERHGARTLLAYSRKTALDLIARRPISAAVINVQLRDDQSDDVRDRLAKLRVPFVVHTGYEVSDSRAPVLQKPALANTVVETLAELLPPKKAAC